MKTDEIKKMVDALNVLNESHVDLIQSMKGTINEVKASRQLWRDGKKSRLIKLGLALIAFPEPAISDIFGTFLIAAGTVQEGIRRRTIYVEDVYKTFHDTLKEILTTKQSL